MSRRFRRIHDVKHNGNGSKISLPLLIYLEGYMTLRILIIITILAILSVALPALVKYVIYGLIGYYVVRYGWFIYKICRKLN